jgi:hypothetical protein
MALSVGEILKGEGTSVKRVLGFFLFVCLLLGAAESARSQTTFAATNNNSYIFVDAVPVAGFNENGLINWFVDNTSQLVQQWYWFRTAGAPGQTALGTLDLVVNQLVGSNGIEIGYRSNGVFAASICYTITGGANSSGYSLITETLTITNLSGSTRSIAWFEYSDLDLSGPSSTFNDFASGNVNGITQSDSLMTASVTHSLTPDAFQIASTNIYNWLLFDPIDDSGTVFNLNNSGSPSSTGDVTFAFQWNLTLAANEGVTITTTKEMNLIPEPGTALLLVLGIAGLMAAHRRRQK